MDDAIFNIRTGIKNNCNTVPVNPKKEPRRTPKINWKEEVEENAIDSIRGTKQRYYCGYVHREELLGTSITLNMERWSKLDQVIECAKDYYYNEKKVIKVEVYEQPAKWETEKGVMRSHPNKLLYRLSKEGEYFYGEYGVFYGESGRSNR